MVNHGVEIHDSHAQQIKRVVKLAAEYHKLVPVLVIASSLAELSELHTAVCNCEQIQVDRVQRLSEFDANGRSLKPHWRTLIDDATRRVGLGSDSSCRVTVTDRFGGRGHDFQVNQASSHNSVWSCSDDFGIGIRFIWAPMLRSPLKLLMSHYNQVVDKESNANGGMLVIATSIPDEREWIQWRGRTARQDRPGQFFVVLDKQGKPFSQHAKVRDARCRIT